MRRRYNDVASPYVRYLTDQEFAEPLLVLEAFFQEYEMAQFRQELRSWFALSCGDHQYRSMKQMESSSMVDMHQQTTRLLEAAYVMWQEDAGQEDAEHAEGFFASMFSFLGLPEWQDELDMLLYYSLDDTPIAEDCDNQRLYFPMYELLDELLQVCEDIYEDEVQQSLQDVLPEGVVITNRDDEYFPPELIMELYKYCSRYEQLIDMEPTASESALSPAFQQQLLSYLYDFPPAATTAGLKRIYLNYLKHLLRHGDFHQDDNGSFVAHMDRLFALLQTAEKEVQYLN